MGTPSHSVVSVHGVSKKYRLFANPLQRLLERLDPFGRVRHKDFWAVSEVSFEVARGECVGLLGRNGSGKSTLLQIVAGVMRPTSGTVSTHGRVAALLALGSGLDPNLTGRENIRFQGRMNDLSETQIARSIDAIAAFADIGEFFDQPLRTYSSGMYARLAFAAAIDVSPDLLIVDEALSVGDAKFQEKCFRRLAALKAAGTSILLVSHNVHTMIQTCDRCVLLDKGRVCFMGAPSDAVNAYHALLYGGSSACPPAIQPPPGSTDRTSDDLSSDTTSMGSARITEWMLSDTTVVERFHTRLSFNPGHARLGDGRARILDYVVVSGEITDAVRIDPDATVQILLRVQFLADVAQPVVGLALCTRDGALVFGTNSTLLSAAIPPAHAGSISVYSLAFRSRLAGGDYFLNVGVAAIEPDGQSVFLDNLRSVAHLLSEPTPGITGVANLGGAITALGAVRLPGLSSDARESESVQMR